MRFYVRLNIVINVKQNKLTESTYIDVFYGITFNSTTTTTTFLFNDDDPSNKNWFITEKRQLSITKICHPKQRMLRKMSNYVLQQGKVINVKRKLKNIFAFSALLSCFSEYFGNVCHVIFRYNVLHSTSLLRNQNYRISNVKYLENGLVIAEYKNKWW